MFLDEKFKDNVKENISVLDLAYKFPEYFKLKKTGTYLYQCRCPSRTHEDKNPSFTINVNKNNWYCSCHNGKKNISVDNPNYGTDVFALYQWIQDKIFNKKINFNQAIIGLCELFGIKIEKSRNEYQYNKLSTLTEVYCNNLFNNISKNNGLMYLYKRGLSKNEIVKWKLGLMNAIDGDKIVFPILDKYGTVIGFNSRYIIVPENKEKYKHSYNSTIFNKSEYFYGMNNLDYSFNEIRITEGCMDVIVADKYGLKNVVCVLGSALTDEHVKILQKLNMIPVFIYDNDEAGKKAFKNSIEALSKVNMYFKLMFLPDNMDLCDYSLKIKNNIEKDINLYSISYSQYKLDKIVNGYKNIINEYKMNALDNILEIFSTIKDNKEKLILADYIQKEMNLDIKEVLTKYGL